MLNNVCVSRRGLNNVCVSRGLNNVCVSRGLKAQQFHSPGLNNVCVSRRGLKAQQFHSPGLNNVCVSQSGLKAQQLPSPGQAKRRPGLGMRAMCAPCKGKSLCLLYTFALTGRSYICLPQPRAPLRLPWAKYFWAFSPLWLTQTLFSPGLWNCWAFSPRLTQTLFSKLLTQTLFSPQLTQTLFSAHRLTRCKSET